MLMPPQQQNPYAFITDPTPPPRRGLNLGMGARVAVVAGGLIILIIVAVVINSFLNGGDKNQVQRLTDIAKAQNEIIRISTLADQKAKAADTKNYAATTRYAIQGAQNDTKKLLAKHGIKEGGLSKTLNASKNTKTDTLLNEATNNNRFDETYHSLMNQQIADYQKLLKAAYDNGTTNEQQTLKTASDSAARLVTAKQ